jgi:pyruvate-formate lyase-activating enzyme
LVARNFEVSPFIPTLAAPVADGLRALLDLPAHLPLSWRPARRPQPDLAVEVQVAGATLRLFAPPEQAPAWAIGPHLSLSHKGELPPEVLTALRRRVLSARPEQPPLAALLSAWRQWQQWQHLNDRELRTVVGDEALIRLGFRCNQDCAFCWQGRTDPDLPVEVAQRWLREIAEAGLSSVMFSGGEPTTYKALPALIAEAKGLGLAVGLQSNAIALARPAYLARLQAAGLSALAASLHSLDPEVSDLVTRAPGTHVQTMAGIRATVAAGVRLALNIVVERRTLPGLPALTAYIAREFPQATVSFAWPNVFYDKAAWRQYLAPLREIRAPLTLAVRQLIDAGVAVAPLGSCGFPACALAEVVDGLALPEVEYYASQDRADRVYAEPCHTCALRPHCPGLRSTYVALHGDGDLRPFAALPAGSATGGRG